MGSYSELARETEYRRNEQAIEERDAHFDELLATVRGLPGTAAEYLMEARWNGDSYHSRPRELVHEFSAEQLITLARDGLNTPERRFRVLNELAATFAAESARPQDLRESKFEAFPRTREDYMEAAFRLQAEAVDQLIHGPVTVGRY